MFHYPYFFPILLPQSISTRITYIYLKYIRSYRIFIFNRNHTVFKTACKLLSKYTSYPKIPSANEETSFTGIIQAAQLGNSEVWFFFARTAKLCLQTSHISENLLCFNKNQENIYILWSKSLKYLLLMSWKTHVGENFKMFSQVSSIWILTFSLPGIRLQLQNSSVYCYDWEKTRDFVLQIILQFWKAYASPSYSCLLCSLCLQSPNPTQCKLPQPVEPFSLAAHREEL